MRVKLRALRSLALSLPAGLGGACGDNLRGEPVDAVLPHEASVDSFMGGTLFGEPCEQPPFPEIGGCHVGEGACNDEDGGAVCRPWCYLGGMPQCAMRGGVEHVTDRGACVCVPQ
jgi:hypothetical protein